MLSNKKTLRIQNGFSLSEQKLSRLLVKKCEALIQQHTLLLCKKITQLNNIQNNISKSQKKSRKDHDKSHDSDLLIVKKIVVLKKNHILETKRRQLKKPLILQDYEVIRCTKKKEMPVFYNK